jgi:small subunit ribosomal protein S6
LTEYEILLMLDAEIPEERGDEIIARIRERVETDGGKWDHHEPWGRRKLAYEIAHKAEGTYHLLLLSAAPETLAEVSRVLKITDGVMRHLAVKRVKGGHTKAPATIGAVSTPEPARRETAPREAAPREVAPRETAPAEVSQPADDSDGAAE